MSLNYSGSSSLCTAIVKVNGSGGGESGVMAKVLETLGVLARVSSLSLRQHIPEILPLIIEALNDVSMSKKAVAITTRD